MSAAQFSEFGHIIESQSCCLLVFEILGLPHIPRSTPQNLKKQIMLDVMF